MNLILLFGFLSLLSQRVAPVCVKKTTPDSGNNAAETENTSQVSTLSQISTYTSIPSNLNIPPASPTHSGAQIGVCNGGFSIFPNTNITICNKDYLGSPRQASEVIDIFFLFHKFIYYDFKIKD